MPDRLLLMPQQRMTLIEFKREGEEPTEIQAFWHRAMGRMGHPVMVIRSVEEFRWVVDTANR